MNAEMFLKGRGVTRLCHFTKLKDLTHIIATDNGILASNAIRPDVRDPKDPARYDGELDYVCCSVEYPNSWYLSKAQGRDNDQVFSEWAVIFIDLSVLRHRSIKFCPCNAARLHGAYIKDNILEMDMLFASPDILNWKRTPKMLNCCPTNGQAEILVKDNIPFNFIKGFAVCDEDDAKRIYSMLKTFGKPDVPIFVAPDVLGTKWSRLIKEGVRPEEIVLFNGKEELQ